MIHKIYTIYDEKAEAYLPPFFLPNDAMAIRTFSDCVQSPEHQFGKHPSDYTLMSSGHFDDLSGEFIIAANNKSLGNGVEFRAPPTGEANGDPETIPLISDEAPILRGPESGNTA